MTDEDGLSHADHDPRDGPERPSLVERIVRFLPVRGWLACAILATVVGAPGAIVVGTLVSGSLSEGLLANHGGLVPGTAWQQATANVLWWLAYILFLWAPLRIRRAVVAAEDDLAGLLPDGRRGFHALFGAVSSPLPAVLVGAVLLASSWDYVLGLLAFSTSPLWRGYTILRLLFIYLAIGTSVWMYAWSSAALYRMGRLELRLIALEDDPLMGLRPAGALALGLALPYFGLMALVSVAAVLAPIVPAFVPTMSVLLLLGLALYFLSLYRLHGQMEAARDARAKALRRQLIDAAAPSGSAEIGMSTESEDETERALLLGIRQSLRGAARVQALEAAHRQVSASPTWPFDTAILQRLAALVLPAVLAIGTEILKRWLQL